MNNDTVELFYRREAPDTFLEVSPWYPVAHKWESMSDKQLIDERVAGGFGDKGGQYLVRRGNKVTLFQLKHSGLRAVKI